MLDKDRVFTHFLTMTGLDAAEAGAFRPLSDAAAQYLLTRLREGVAPGKNLDRLCLAAAALAYGDWLELGGSLCSAQELRVGDIALRESSGNRAPRGASMREHFLAGVADLLAPRFVMAQVPDGQPPAQEETEEDPPLTEDDG